LPEHTRAQDVEANIEAVKLACEPFSSSTLLLQGVRVLANLSLPMERQPQRSARRLSTVQYSKAIASLHG
jgi:hypothetical protein